LGESEIVTVALVGRMKGDSSFEELKKSFVEQKCYSIIMMRDGGKSGEM
jgi:hypothetical protein